MVIIHIYAMGTDLCISPTKVSLDWTSLCPFVGMKLEWWNLWHTISPVIVEKQVIIPPQNNVWWEPCQRYKTRCRYFMGELIPCTICMCAQKGVHRPTWESNTTLLRRNSNTTRLSCMDLIKRWMKSWDMRTQWISYIILKSWFQKMTSDRHNLSRWLWKSVASTNSIAMFKPDWPNWAARQSW